MQTQILDTEVYRDYFLAMFKDVATGAVTVFEKFLEHPLDVEGLRAILRRDCIITFNGNSYDMLILALALSGASNERIKTGSDAIIQTNLRSWQFEREFNIKIPKSINHVDLIEVAPGVASLKIYGGRLHAPKMQDLPFEPSDLIHPEDVFEVKSTLLREYCGNDLGVTLALYNHLLPNIQLREQMGKMYGIDLRSKSDAQIAEAVIAKEVAKIKGEEVTRPKIEAGTSFQYRAPDFVQFQTPELKAVAALIAGLDFVVPATGGVAMPKALKDYKIKIGMGVYRMGIGGLHSSEKCAAHVANADTLLIDRDVDSYYPRIILNTGLAPAHMGAAFTTVYNTIVDRRLEAKAAGRTVEADALKITVNGSFGKFGNKWSILFAPQLMIQTTVTGQLALLMLIESLEGQGIPVVSANTDGVVIKCPVSLVSMMDLCVWEWETLTGFTTSATEYRAIYSRDVNNYIALKKGGGAKLKGAFAPSGLQKNPTAEICTGAVVKYLMDGTPVDDSILACTDPRKFVSVRQVKGGAVQYGRPIGKAVRWYYSIAAIGAMHYKLNGNKVPLSEGALPMMQLPETIPADLDMDWYITEAHSILKEIGVS
jgi:hypothetical protein